MEGKNFAVNHHVYWAVQKKSIRLAAVRSARGWFICVPSYNVGKLRSSPTRPIGPHRTYSIKPSSISALGAIIMVPPVNLLLLKVRKRQGR